MEAVPFTRIHFVYLELFSLVEVALFSGSRAIQGKPFILVETTPFNGNRCFWQKSFYLVGIFLSGSHFVYLNSSLLLEAIPFNRKMLLLVEAVSFIWSRFFSGSHSFQWKPFRLFGAAFFSGSRKQKSFLIVEIIAVLQWK